MNIEVRLHHTTGKVTRFCQTDPTLANQLIQAVDPAKVFTGPNIAVAGEGLMTLLPTAHITHLDLITTRKLNWPKPPGAMAMFVLPDETPLRVRSSSANGVRAPGEPIVAHLTYDFLGGGRLCVEVCGKAGYPFEARAKLNRLLANPPLYFTLPGGGATIVNPTNIVRVFVATRVAKLPPTGIWRAELQKDW